MLIQSVIGNTIYYISVITFTIMTPSIILRVSESELDEIDKLIYLKKCRSRADFVRKAMIISLEKERTELTRGAST